MKKVSVGSISHGTLRTCDLLYNFAVELDYLKEDESDNNARARMYAVLGDDLELPEENEDVGRELLEQFESELSELAPAYCFFGAHPGDGSDFGFWPDFDAIDELPRVDDPADVPAHAGEECVFVNDHGNVTLYAADGSVAWDCV